MHVGRIYPYATSFWLCEAFFWPGYIPRKLWVQCPAGSGSDWDSLAAGLAVPITAEDIPGTGDVVYGRVVPSTGRALDIRFHQVSTIPKRYSIVVRFRSLGGPSIVLNGEFDSPQYSFPAPWGFYFVSNFPPFSLGGIPPITVRAAVWAEV